MMVEFEALIKEMKIKSLVSGDKEARLLFEFSAENNSLIEGINRLHRANEMVIVRIDKKQK